MRAKPTLFLKGAICVLFASVALGSGCTYTQDRLKDFVDITGLKMVWGPGVKAGFGVGAAKTGLMLGYYRFEKFGWQGRAMGVTEETGLEIFAPADHDLKAVWGNKELFDMVAEFKEVDGYASRAGLFDLELTYPRRRYHVPDGFHIADAAPASFPGFVSLGDMQATFALFVGLEANLSLFQFADFWGGWFGVDIAKDDARNYTPVGPTEE